MFCPACRTEYRPGFTKCADCGVDLVSNFRADSPATDENVITNSEGLELLWSGLNKPLSNRIDYALNTAHIFHKVTDKGLGLLPTYPGSVAFVWIDPKDRAAARAILEKVLDKPETVDSQFQDELMAESARVNPLGLDRRVYNRVPDQAGDETEDDFAESEDSGEPTPNDIVEDFDPDDATVEVWSGEDHEMAEYLKLCLPGVGVGCVLRKDGEKTHVLVLPSAEARAREIVREVIEGTPPQ
ncbi:MAG TPA: hypothetical protein VEJ46_10430 [Candidatus Acidoferrum sp.]|nr:hypothetical protein [Candidatus Acidoferrum sp.]